MDRIKLFLDSDEDDSQLGTNIEYVKNYNNYRQKEEYNKLKTKYGDHFAKDDSSDSSSDESIVSISDQLELDFFTTLASLKNKDPSIYDASKQFFKENLEISPKKKKTKQEPMTLRDYERKLLLDGGLDSSNENDKNSRSLSPSYNEQQQKLKEDLKHAAADLENDAQDDWGGMFKVRVKSEVEMKKEETDYKQWLLGNRDHLKDQNAENTLQPLKKYWNDTKLNKSDKFLKDYILHNRFLENPNPNYVPTYDEIIHDSDVDLSEDEAQLEQQEQFEHKYNYRFEDPDTDFIKRYPRMMEQSLRATTDKRKVKRLELKERKQREKQEKFNEIEHLKELKRKEIEEKLKKLQEISGDVKFEDHDLEADFDPDAHDAYMKAQFNKEYYEIAEVEDRKPDFPELDEELEIERWDRYETQVSNANEPASASVYDIDINMDCDYNPDLHLNNVEDISKSKLRKTRRKSKFGKAVSIPKPPFDPNSETYDKYLEEYYKLDCEDIIGNIPCRFKYRSVVPNSFGLSIEEILTANDRELNRWCSLKKTFQHRPDHVEDYDVIAFKNKGSNDYLKHRLIPSLFEDQSVKSDTAGSSKDDMAKQTMKSVTNKKRKNTHSAIACNTAESKERKVDEKIAIEEVPKHERSRKTKKSMEVVCDEKNVENKIENAVIKKETKSIVKHKNTVTVAHGFNDEKVLECKTSKCNNNSQATNSFTSDVKFRKGKINKSKLMKSKEKISRITKINKSPKKEDSGISNARLKAFGLNPKKYRNKLKYGPNYK